MHGLLTFVLIPSTHTRPPPVKENVVSSSLPGSYKRVYVTVLELNCLKVFLPTLCYVSSRSM